MSGRFDHEASNSAAQQRVQAEALASFASLARLRLTRALGGTKLRFSPRAVTSIDKHTNAPQRPSTPASSAALAIRSLWTTATNDPAVRRVVIGLLLLLPVAVSLPVQRLEHLLLVLSMMLVVFAEVINSAIEIAVDRISLDTHPLSKAAKDTAAAAVVVAVLMSGLCWTVIAGPVAWAMLVR